MAKTSLTNIKNWFKTGLKPTETQFWNTWDSFWHKDEKIPIGSIDDITNILLAKADAQVLSNHKLDANAHSALFETKVDKIEGKGLSTEDFSTEYRAQLDTLAGSSIAQHYADATAMIADQANQKANNIYTADAPGGDATVLVGAADYEYLGTVLGTIADYRKLSEQESMDIVVATPTTGIVPVAATAYTFLLTDVTKKVIFSAATAVTATIPTNAVTAIPIGGRIEVTQSGNGVVTLVTTGLTVISASPLYLIKGQTVTLIKTAIDTWSIEGNNLNGEITFPAYPNTRTDGVLLNNKIMSTDANGKVGLYSTALGQAPYLDYVVPDSTLPGSTGNFQLYGSFFTLDMTLLANLATSIIFEGQTINYAIFHSSNWIEVNVTMGAAEGYFEITLNNGISKTFPNAILLVLGTVFSPLTADWINIIEPIDVADGSVMVKTLKSQGSADWGLQELDYTKAFEVRCKIKRSPLGISTDYNRTEILHLKRVSDGVTLFMYDIRVVDGQVLVDSWSLSNGWVNNTIIANTGNLISNFELVESKALMFFWDLSTMYVYVDTLLKHTLTQTFAENLKLTALARDVDIIDIKYIELAT